jgi:hypothetical protein
MASADVLGYVSAFQNYYPEDDAELTLTTGEVIAILSKEEVNWWYGRKEDGREGYFPVDYVREYFDPNLEAQQL